VGEWKETYSAGIGITLESAVAAAVKTGRCTTTCGEIAVPASLKKKKGKPALVSREDRPAQSQEKNADPDSSRLPIVRDGKLSGSIGGGLPPIYTKISS
jgi:hypothetical protein